MNHAGAIEDISKFGERGGREKVEQTLAWQGTRAGLGKVGIEFGSAVIR